jgi:hypothetical protein
MEQCSHQILKSGFAISVFVTGSLPVLVDGRRRLLKSENTGIGVIRLVFAGFVRTGQHQHSGQSHWVFAAVAVIDSEQNWRMALPAKYAEVPSLVGA